MPDKNVHYLAFEHFQERLKERYNLDISRQQYVDLLSVQIDIIRYTDNNRRVIGFLIFKKQKIMVVKGNKGGPLITVIPIPKDLISGIIKKDKRKKPKSFDLIRDYE